MSVQEFLENITLEELEELRQKKLEMVGEIPSFSYSKIKENHLEQLFNIKQVIFSEEKFEEWFDVAKKIDISEKEEQLETLLKKEKFFINKYLEEDLKVKFLAPIFNMVDFSIPEFEIRDFYEQPLTYKTDKFILNGTTDFIVAKGVRRAKKPYFFIQEFKQNREFSDPEPQLLAELIAGVELNSWKEIKGAYIVGAIWNFVILEKVGENSYRYFVSENFDSTKIEDLKNIYKNLVFIKNEIEKDLK
jgi:uncharacterized protein YfkK (UPF0435 family)